MTTKIRLVCGDELFDDMIAFSKQIGRKLFRDISSYQQHNARNNNKCKPILHVTLENDAKSINNNFEHASTKDIVSVLNRIQPLLKSNHTSSYLQKKIDAVENENDEQERRIKCSTLKPYVDWYLQGISTSE